MKALWVVQSSCISESDSKGMIDVIKDLDLKLEILHVVPFVYDNIHDYDYIGPIIPYGGTNLIEKIRTTKKWTCWFTDDFNYKKYLEKFGKYMFNSDAKCIKMNEFSPSMYKKGEYLFIRPNKDLKEFAGFNTKPEDFMTWYRKIQRQYCEIKETTDIVVAQSSNINTEWRIFVVDNEPVDGSRYRKDHYQSIVHDVPDKVYDFVRKMCKIWTPAPVFVMDICELNGELYILELGDFHSAGWYATDKKLIIKTISEYAEKYGIKKHISPMSETLMEEDNRIFKTIGVE